MFTSKKKFFQKATAFTLALSLSQMSWVGAALWDGDSNANLKSPMDVNNSSILNINSVQPQASGSSLSLNGNTQITNSKTKINISLRDSDVKQVLRMLADKAGMNIIFHDSVSGKVTLDLVNTTLNDAFLLVMGSLQLSYSIDAGTIIVSSKEAAKSLSFSRQNLTVIPIKYVDAGTVANFLNTNIFSANIAGLTNDKIVTSNPRQNEVMVLGTKNDIDMAKKVIEKLDTKPMINTFKVNHTTPKEMANLVCSTVVQTTDSSSGSGGGGTSSGTTLSSDSDSSSSSSSGSSSSGSSGGSSGVGAISLGGGVVACRAAGGTTAGSGENTLASFGATPLTVAYFPNHGNISIYGGSIEQVQVIKEYIEQNDKKQPMAYVEVSVVELNEQGSKEFNNEWRLWTPFLSVDFDTSNGLSTNQWKPTFFAGDRYTIVDDEGAPKYTISKMDGNNTLVYKLKYLVENSKGRVLTNPKIMITNGQKSVIDMTADYVKTVKSEILTTTGTGASGISKTYEIGNDEGLRIELLPFISPDGYVSLNIVPEFSTIKEKIYAKGQSGEDELVTTLLQRRNLELKSVRVKDGETLVLAGLIRETETQNVTKVPVLGDLPVVGIFFRSSKDTKAKEELVILITPHIIYSADEIARIKSQDL